MVRGGTELKGPVVWFVRVEGPVEGCNVMSGDDEWNSLSSPTSATTVPFVLTVAAYTIVKSFDSSEYCFKIESLKTLMKISSARCSLSLVILINCSSSPTFAFSLWRKLEVLVL